MSIAIITGASSGLGKEYFSAIVEEFPEIQEFWVIARRKDKLKELSEAYPDKTVAAICLDLTDPQSLEIFGRVLEEQKPVVEVLINNSGFGKLGDFSSSELKSQAAMIDLNVRALTVMTHLVLPYMQDDGIIINVSSIASFVPTPGMSVYSSTKAYVTSFTRALRDELKGRGINALAVCPGPMDTEFNKVAGIGGNSPRFENLPKDTIYDIAHGSVVAALDGKGMYTGKFFFKFYHFLSKILPHSFLMRFTSL